MQQLKTSPKYFGTDGVRGRLGASLINPEFVLKLGWAAGKVLSHKNGDKILIGKDTRISGYLLESLLEAGITAAGVDAYLLGPMPTPGIAYLTRTFRANAGIVISASHNPYYDNGIKFFSPDGTKISQELEQAIEIQIEKPLKMVDAIDLGKAKRIDDAGARYIEFCKSTLGLRGNLSKIKIVIDCANGATYNIAPHVFRELDAEVIEIGTTPNGFNINENCGSTYPDTLIKAVQKEKADIGIAFDGDGDRVIMIDHLGEIVDGDELLFIIAKHQYERGLLEGGIVGTQMSNLGLELALRNLNIDFYRSKVGDKYVLEALREKGWILGGKSSGHIVHLGITTTGDGIVSALQVLLALRESGKDLHKIKKAMRKFPQILINVNTPKVINIDRNAKIQSVIKLVEKKLANKGRVLVRPSGTEPIIRVMVEGEDLKLVKASAEAIANVITNQSK